MRAWHAVLAAIGLIFGLVAAGNSDGRPAAHPGRTASAGQVVPAPSTAANLSTRSLTRSDAPPLESSTGPEQGWTVRSRPAAHVRIPAAPVPPPRSANPAGSTAPRSTATTGPTPPPLRSLVRTTVTPRGVPSGPAPPSRP